MAYARAKSSPDEEAAPLHPRQAAEKSSPLGKLKTLLGAETQLPNMVIVAVVSSLVTAAAMFSFMDNPWAPHSTVAAGTATTSSKSTGSRFLIDSYGVLGPISWEHLSPAVQSDFSLEGRVLVMQWETPESLRTESTQPYWARATIDRLVAVADQRDASVGNKLCTYADECNDGFFRAMQAYPVKGKSVLVVGSRNPWAEAICISFGAASITSVDFNVPIVEDERVRAISIAELDATQERFDALVSYSSLEHDGLGRYGDPINPFGDLQRMEKLKGLVKPGGRLYLGVPNGNDTLVFYAHRIYGPIRFPMLIQGWRLLDTFSIIPFDTIMKSQNFKQPLHVLELES